MSDMNYILKCMICEEYNQL